MKIQIALTISLLFFTTLAYALTPNIDVLSDARLEHLGKMVSNRLNQMNITPAKPNGLVITLGPESLEKESKNATSSAILALYVTSTEFKRIMSLNNTSVKGRTVSAIYQDVDPRYQVILAGLISPVSKKLVAVTSETEVDISPALETFIIKQGGVVSTIDVGDTKGMLSRMDGSDALIALKDESLINDATIKPIISSLYRRKKFLIGFSKKMTTSGALASVEINMDSYLNQGISSISQFLKSGQNPGVIFPSSYEISVNKTLAKALGFYDADIDEAMLTQKLKESIENSKHE